MKKKLPQPKYPSYDNPASAFLSGNFAPSLQPRIAIKIKPPKKKG